MGQLLTSESKLKEVYAHPVGHDIIHRVLTSLKLKDALVNNPIVGNMRLQTLSGLIKKNLGDYGSLLTLLNTEQDIPASGNGRIQEAWWKEAVFYQIYPRSFMDSDGDGIGDLQGIISRLDDLKELGVDVLWLSPVYDSPNDDNGYDIRDYYQIMRDFGTMDDFDQLLSEVHKRGMRLIMDLVINHTSDEHKWFQEALHDSDSKYRNYYHFRPGNGGKTPPNNWTSFFSGSAWNYYKEQDVWALHLFSKKQMDLNWDCKEMREEILTMIRWWLEKGIDGFRMDVINYISKVEGLPDGNETIGELIGYRGIENYFYGPRLHEYLREIRKEAFDPYQAYSVGEMPGIGMEMSKLLTGDDRKELDMMFSFDHLETPGHNRFDDYRYDLNFLKEYLIDYTEHYGNHCHMALFYNNHDNPKFISKVDPDGTYRDVLAKMLAVIQFTSRGTPYLFQGDEIGAANQHFQSIDDLRDVESLNLYQQLTEERKMTKEKALETVFAGTRDHARTPMQWNPTENGGFTTGSPWISGDRDYLVYNVESESEDPDSVLNFYKRLIALRKEEKAFAYGETEFVKKHVKGFFLYYRIYHGDCFFIECNLTPKIKERFVDTKKYELLLSNYEKPGNDMMPYEANIYRGR
ncbi:MAG: alpha-glucosidase [bacterium]|nr:alpha-glucosidase [bacterium]